MASDPKAEKTEPEEAVEADTGASGKKARTPGAARPRRAAARPKARGGRTATPARAARRQRAEPAQAEAAARARPRLEQRYREEIAPVLMREFGYSNPMQVPRPVKAVLNIGLGEALTNAAAIDAAVRDLATIGGQRPVVTRARRSIANFKLREGNRIGVMATLRGDRMWEFLDRLLNAALPRVRDFRGVPRDSFDGRGNYTLGLTEQVVFPEIDYNRVDKLRGLQVTVVTSARTDEEARRFLELLGMPFARPAEFAVSA